MKHFLLSLFFIFYLGFITHAQTNVNFIINHQLNNNYFDANTVSSNNMGDNFNIFRLEYYISEITVVHDEGIETTINDLWVLVDVFKAASINVDLGNHDITNVEGIKFHIGVNPEKNHENPADYSIGHPLAPTDPSMHWGWASGYRFLAFEGYAGANLDQNYQLHGLDDANYFETSIDYTTTAENGNVNIVLDADYAKGLEDISLNNGVIVHGAGGAAKLALENFRDYVFKASTTSVSTLDFSEVNRFDVSPNPTLSGMATINLASSKDLEYEVVVTDILGREVKRFNNVSGNSNLEITLENKGFYFVSLIKLGKAVLNRKLLVE